MLDIAFIFYLSIFWMSVGVIMGRFYGEAAEDGSLILLWICAFVFSTFWPAVMLCKFLNHVRGKKEKNHE